MNHYSLSAFIWKFLSPQKWIFLSVTLVSCMWSLDATIWPLLLQKVIDIFTRFENNREAAWPLLVFPISCGVVFWLSVEAGFRAQGFLLARALPRLEANIRLAMFDHIQHHSPKYFNEHFSGSLANKITDMTSSVTQIIQQCVTTFVPAFLTCLLGIIIFSRISPIFAMILGTWLLIHIFLCFIFTFRCDRIEHVHGEARSLLLGKIVDSFTNNFVVNLFYRFGYEKLFISRFQQDEQKKNTRAKNAVEMMRVCLGINSFLGAGLAVSGTMFYFWLHGKITTGEFAQIWNTTWNISTIVWIVGFSLPAIIQSIGTAKQALTLMNDPQDVIDAPEAKPLVVSQGEITFDDVSFQYDKKAIFQNKNVPIRGGEKVGLVGYSGAGKSTFVNLILRFFPLQSGNIFIDGQPISTVTLESLRQQIALIPQDPILFHRSLYDNIMYGKSDASEDEVLKAAKLAHCNEFIEQLPYKYQSVVGERGTKLSGGERQRIAIARAVLSNAPILILDEATSSLDSVTEKYIQESLKWLMQGRTTIVIAHRLSTLAGMDRILVFDQGKIIEEGSHSELLAKNGHYANLWKMQAGGFLPI